MSKIVVMIVAIVLIGFISWWFFGNHQQAAVAADVSPAHQQNVQVIVDGGYKPETVMLKKGIPAQVTFKRRDPSSCLERVVFPDLGINEFLPEQADHPITIDTSQTAEYDYACGMNMFHGKVIVK
ncbi:cupredoxin domain-containing protein [Bombilactobacillus bombi]|uniref:Cupredoxin domain-containing protein n=1 Tax=Bombilactobacillus bombi TaxID=1303590 RepID=A0A417Z431_9LACO|nr:cupredoxin domain-containing protein [Bombilactobacillus bombi]RHW45438.1 cupredoxin domain-containing protein [Bombilactobacillus bombi]